ncbi:MAG: glutathione S-transferase family protein [Comamonas sp.]|nr:glutathione S-transferase family protein [Comamonas sp.]
MHSDRRVTFYHAPQSRSAGVRILVEELGADHDLVALDLQAGQQREPAYLAINPMGKVPALRHGEALITEQAAVYQYLAELYPEHGLVPPVGDALRGPFLRWMVFYGSCFEPAVVDRALKRDSGGRSMSPYGDYASVMQALIQQLTPGPWLLGERFTVADVLWGSALGWMQAFKLLPESPEIQRYVARFSERPAVRRAAALDQALIAARKPG